MTYPPEAYSPDGSLWWELTLAPGRKITPGRKPQLFGVEQKLSAWLRFNKAIGDTFTTREARSALGEPDVPNADEHFQRRLRELRGRDKWVIPSRKYDPSLQPEQYRVDKIGWHPGCGEKRPKKNTISKAKKRAAFDRDGWMCVVCGARSGEPQVDDPDKTVVLTAGHVLSADYGGSADIRNIRTECSSCNETVRSERPMPESPDEVATAIRALRTADRVRLAQWIESGRYLRSAAEEVYDRYRQLAPGDQDTIKASIRGLAGLGGT
jgi:hypothetical protein